MAADSSRRRFLGQSAKTLGLLGWAGYGPVHAQEPSDKPKGGPPSAVSASTLTERGCIPAAAPGCQGRMVDSARAGGHGPGRDGSLAVRPCCSR